MRPIIAQLSGGLGFGLLTAWIILAIMIVPTIAAISEDALRSIPEGVREASYAMGATKWQTIWRVLLPAAKIGIISIELAPALKKPEKTIRRARAVISTKPPAPAVTCGRAASFETFTEPSGSICRKESSEQSKPAAWK